MSRVDSDDFSQMMRSHRSKWEFVQALTVCISLQNQAWTASHKGKLASYDKPSVKHEKSAAIHLWTTLKKKKKTLIQWNMFAWGLNAPWTLIQTLQTHIRAEHPTPPHIWILRIKFINCHPLRTKMAPRYNLRDDFHPRMVNANRITSIHWNFWRKLHF